MLWGFYVLSQEKYKKLKIDVDVFDFTNEIEKKMMKADFAVSRAGASTLWELSANALPTLFIPYPYAASDHQYANAKFLVDKGMAYVKRENEITTKFFFDCIKGDISNMSKLLVDSIKHDSIESIVDIILDEYK